MRRNQDKINTIQTPAEKINSSNSMLNKQSVKQNQTSQKILSLQQTIGNQAVGQLMTHDILRPKLTMGTPGDVYEQEADATADKVMSMSHSQVQRQSDEEEVHTTSMNEEEVQSSLGKEEVQMSPEDDELHFQSMEEDTVQGKGTVQREGLSDSLSSQIQGIKSGGQPMPKASRDFFEPRFGADFSNVKIHNDSTAHETSAAINAKAYTLGNHVAFGKGQYNPESSEGKHLMAHELTHVVQQGGAPSHISKTNKVTSNKNTIQRFGDKGHSDATESLVGFTTAQMKDIQFGNWLIDMRQISLVQEFLNGFAELDNTDCQEIVSVLAEDKFGKDFAKRVNNENMTKYKEEEHFDNPNKYPVNQKVQPFIFKSSILINILLGNAIDKGNTPKGREYFGNALHVVQDFFAHSNFVEISLKLSGAKSNVDTQGGTTTRGEDILTSGIFEKLDTAISLGKMLADKIKEPPKPGQHGPAASTRIAIIILKKSKYKDYAESYEKFLHGVNSVKTTAKKVVPKWLQNGIALLKSIVANFIAQQINEKAKVAAKSTGAKGNPSHSKLAKDSDLDTRGFFPIAHGLSTIATLDFGETVRNYWTKINNAGTQYEKTKLKSEAKVALKKLVIKYIAHPTDTDWWKEYIKK